MAKDAFNKRKELLRRNTSSMVKKKIVKTVVWSVASYGGETWRYTVIETWTLKKEKIRRLQALAMRIWRKMERVSWKDKKTNEEVLKAVGYERTI